MYLKARITRILIDFFGDDNRRIEHALNVLAQAQAIMDKSEGYDEDIVVACALLHDVGIKESEARYGYNNGLTQEQFGPSCAQELLKSIDFPAEKIEKVKEIIGNHHTPSRYDYLELKILKEADRIVNSREL